jgi:YD repeat-containing protein
MLRRTESSEGRLAKPLGASRSGAVHGKTRRAMSIAAGIALLSFSVSAFAASSANYTYDAMGRLTKVTYSDDGETTTISYSYDAAGNRTSVVSASPS